MLNQDSDPSRTPDPQQPSGESSNRTFMIAVGVLGGLVLLTILAVLAYVFFVGPNLTAQKTNQQATIEAHNAEIQAAMTSTMMASLWTATPLPSPVVMGTNTPSPTPVVNIPTGTSIYDPLTATMAALYTEAANSALTPTSTLVGPGGLPEGGIGDKFSYGGLLLAAAALVVVIFLARRLRHASNH